MRLKTFTAATMAEAMERVRQSLGEDAVIISSQTIPNTGDVWVTAAIEQADDVDLLPTPGTGSAAIIQALNDHGAPLGLIDKLLDGVHAAGPATPEIALAAALETRLHFVPIEEKPLRPVMLVGPPGSGKTVAAAKLAARARLDGRECMLISTDTGRAGGAARLAAFAQILKTELHQSDGKSALAELTRAANGRAAFIDSASVNPFDPAEMSEIAKTAAAGGAEPVLVLAAGGDALESAEIGRAFAAVGVSRMIATRLDTARRHGGILAAANGALAIAELGASPTIGDGLLPANAATLAHALLERIGAPPTALPEANRNTPEAVS
ncbi:MAG TPA: GTP-binding protein [Alphaproteobacteria bacterium]|nr:GTP-binding protein [Alphaproteobacteria bacterium]